MAMPFKRLPRRFIIELVNKATILINLISRIGGVHDAMSVRQLVTGKVLRIPMCKIGEYVHEHVPTTNKTDKLWTGFTWVLMTTGPDIIFSN